ncbi:putative deoxyribonuclease tatdn2 [Borealophlyctis nickersoniae]|nr:putative deoxyribonuclease tatdn2 [Borealophlyctis nickersoniae]
MASRLSTPLKYVDTHVHIEYILHRLKKPLSHWPTLRSTFPSSYESCIHIACSQQSFTETTTLLAHDPTLRVAYGIHPSNASEFARAETDWLKALDRPETIAVGECGLDRLASRSLTDQELQKKVFRQQMQVAVAKDLPLVVHLRENEREGIEMMKESLPKDHRVHLHCFTGEARWAEEFVGWFVRGFVGFTGVVTYKTAENVRDAVRSVPLERLLVETDGPFLTPAQVRREVCHSGMVPYNVAKLAEVKGIPLSDMYRILRENTKTVYGI